VEAIRGCPRETTPRVAQCTNFRSPTITPTTRIAKEREREKKPRAVRRGIRRDSRQHEIQIYVLGIDDRRQQ